MVNFFDLSNQLAVVTGGEGFLGQHICSSLVDYGCQVYSIDLQPNPVVHNNHYFKYQQEGRIKTFYQDLRHKKNVEAALETICNAEKRAPTILVHCAATDFKIEDNVSSNVPFEDLDEKLFEAVVSGDLKLAKLCSQVFGSAMAREEGGSIINISSIYGVVSPNQEIYRHIDPPWIKPITYSMTKSSLMGLTKYLATYWADKNVRVNAISPGGIERGNDEEFKEKYKERVPMKRMGRPEDVCGPIIFLASRASSYITGENIVIDGGLTSW